MRRPLVASLLLLALGLPAVGAEPVAATPWDVRREAQELLDDLAHKRGDEGQLVERAQALLAANGSALIATGNGSAPIAVVLPQKLRELGLLEAFVRTFDAPAARRLRELGDAARDDQLLAIAYGYPGTGAARAAWTRLADRAWDAGRLNRFVAYARAAGDLEAAAEAPRRKRYEAGLALLAPHARPDLPATFDGLSEVWRLTVEARHAVTPRRRRRNEEAPPQPSLALAAASGEAVAASDGVRLVVVDHLIGRQQGPVHALGNVVMGGRECRPVVIRDGFVALGKLNEQRVVLQAVDRLGQRLWQALSPQAAGEATPIAGVSAPIAVDGLVVYAATVLDDETADLRVHAVDARTGKPAWDASIARLPGARRAMWGETPLTPMLCAHAGSLLVLSNCGVLARLGADGAVQRVWGYPSTTADEINAMPGMGGTRLGAVVSDGATAIITPADNTGIALLIAGDGEPEPYRGDGAGDDVLAAADGIALFAGRRLTCIELGSRKKRWSRPLKLTNAQATIGRDLVAVCADENLMMLSLVDGTAISQRTFEARTHLAVVDQSLVFGGPDFIAAYAGSASSIEQLAAAAKAAPDDYRPLVRLAALMHARRDNDAALARYAEALARGAPADYAERAAVIVRERLDLAAGDAKGFADALARLEALAAFDPTLRDEAGFWRARDAELRGDRVAALAGYETCARAGERLVPLRDGVHASLRTLGRAGRFRLGAETAPLAPQQAQTESPPPAAAWSTSGRRAPRSNVVAGGLLIGYADGFLVGHRLADGGEAWWRKPNRPLLGVQSVQEMREDGVPIKVMEGTSAEAAGLRSGDLLVEFNGRQIRNFGNDLVKAVMASPPRSPYTVVVIRGEQRLELKGTLGGEMVEPIASNDRTVLVWPLAPQGGPEGMWISALDAATGTELFPRLANRPTTETQEASAPLLTPDDAVIVADGADLVALEAHAVRDVEAGGERWRLAGRSRVLPAGRMVGSRLLWLPALGEGRGELVDTATGEVMASLPSDSEDAPLVDGFEVYARLPDGTAICWDVGAGRERWRSPAPVASLVAARGDAVYVITQESQLAVLDRGNGTLRRTWGDWSSAEPVGIVGDRLYLSARDRETDLAIALALGSGAAVWSQPLPARTEVQAWIPSAAGLSLVVRDGDHGWLARFGADGGLAGVVEAASEHRFFAVGDALIDAGPEGARIVRPALPAAPAPAPCVRAEPGADLKAAASATLPRLTWIPCGETRYALARAGASLLVFAADGAELELHLGDAGATLDAQGMALRFLGGDAAARFEPGQGSWRLTAQARLDGITVVRLDPPVDRASAQPLAVRAESATGTDGPAGPWWLASAWRLVAAPAGKDGA